MISSDPAMEMLRKVQILLGYHSSKEHAEALWSYALDIMQAELEYVNGEKKRGTARIGDFEDAEERGKVLVQMGKTMSLVAIVVGVKGGGKLQGRF